MNKRTLLSTLPAILAASVIGINTATARDGHHDDSLRNQYEPITLLINYQIIGTLNGDMSNGAVYTVGGPGYAPEKIFPNGEVSDEIEPEHQVALLEGAQITFDQTDPMITTFTCLAGSCTMKLKDGGVLVSNAGVPLEGRAINMWGPVYKSPTFDPANGIIPIRILGCGGLKEVAGKGRVANMVGSVCFNGVFNYNMMDQTKLTGSSKCTITMHTPINPAMIP